MWRKSSKSDSANCVEVRRDLSAVRDSKDPGRALAAPGLPALIGLLRDGQLERNTA
jgi:hypothetical protein